MFLGKEKRDEEMLSAEMKELGTICKSSCQYMLHGDARMKYFIITISAWNAL